MIDYSEIEKMEGRKVSEIKPKEGAEDVYIVVFADNLEEDWCYKDGKWSIIA